MDLKLPTGGNLEVEEALVEDEETLGFIATHLKNMEKEVMVHSVIQIPILSPNQKLIPPNQS